MTRDLMWLIAARKKALEADGQWTDYSDEQASEAFAEVEKLQVALLDTDFSDPHHRLAALDLLLDGYDQPNFADDFKNRLFGILQQLIAGKETDEA